MSIPNLFAELVTFIPEQFVADRAEVVFYTLPAYPDELRFDLVVYTKNAIPLSDDDHSEVIRRVKYYFELHHMHVLWSNLTTPILCDESTTYKVVYTFVPMEVV